MASAYCFGWRKAMREEVGRRIRELRKARGLTQAQAAERAALNVNYYADTERNGANLTLDTLERVADALEVPIGDLFRFTSDETDDDGREVIERVRRIVEHGPAERVKRLRIFLEQVLG
jgi:transcriptional regulator with XRE-family HTH domain